MRSANHAGRLILLVFWVLLAVSALFVLGIRLGSVPPIGTLLDPVDGLYYSARHVVHEDEAVLDIEALQAPVTIIRDERGVPHIFAENDHDAVVALGYVVAQDRLFQLDFLPRVASGRLSEVFGASSVETDRFLRSTGMEIGARRNVERMQQDSLESALIEAYAAGANAYMDSLDERDLPFEFRLIGYWPEPYTALSAARLLQYFAFDLTFRTDAEDYAVLQSRLGEATYQQLYPRFQQLFVPIIPSSGGAVPDVTSSLFDFQKEDPAGRGPLTQLAERQRQLRGTVAQGFVEGKGSNNWVAHGSRTATGSPILAGDMHLSVTLPSIWYEVHLVTPTMNTYGVTTPGTPLPVEAFTDHVAWAFTNTGADVIDHYALALDSTGTRYRYDGGWRDLRMELDTIRVAYSAPVIDTLYFSHWGPVLMDGDEAVALQWAAHEPSRTMTALWGMHHARNLGEFEEALRYWDTPMQNIAQADVEGNIAIRSTGYLPIRRSGHGVGLLDGSTDAGEWVGRVPFEELPEANNPAQGFLTSTNQQPTDENYPYYLGHDWRSSYRSLRIDSLMRGKSDHTVEDFKRYQADVHAMQYELFVPLLESLTTLSSRADSLRQLLVAWDGNTTVDRPEPLVLDEFLDALTRFMWDEPVFRRARRPAEYVLYGLLVDEPTSPWLDIKDTPEREDAGGLLRYALEATADTLEARYGWGAEHWRWGDHHHIVFKHLTQSSALEALWRGPLEYPGFASTLSPAGRRETTHTASWRVVVDFSQTPPVGFGMYPGGQSGDPFSPLYDAQVMPYVQFQHYNLHKPASPDDISMDLVTSLITLRPPSTR